MYDGIKECADYAHERGVTLAVETGPEIATTLKAFIEDVGEGIGVNLDPANFVMVTGQDPAEAVYLLKDYIVHTHMKDGKMLRKTGRAPELIYEQHLVDPEDLAKFSNLFIETPVGEGSVDWDKYIAALRDIGFNGYLTIERECGDNPAADIKLAADFARTNGWID